VYDHRLHKTGSPSVRRLERSTYTSIPLKPINLPKAGKEYIRRWVDNIKRDLGEVGWGNVEWIGLAQDRNRWRALVNSVLNLRVS
jgi:hypothetical protein